MNRKEIVAELNKRVQNNEVKFDDVTSIYHKPHPYMIGAKHLSRNDSTYLGKEQILSMEKKHGPMCCMPQCKLRYEQHTCDTVIPVKCYIKLDKFPIDIEDLKENIASEKIDGFMFINCFSKGEQNETNSTREDLQS